MLVHSNLLLKCGLISGTILSTIRDSGRIGSRGGTCFSTDWSVFLAFNGKNWERLVLETGQGFVEAILEALLRYHDDYYLMAEEF